MVLFGWVCVRRVCSFDFVCDSICGSNVVSELVCALRELLFILLLILGLSYTMIAVRLVFVICSLCFDAVVRLPFWLGGG